MTKECGLPTGRRQFLGSSPAGVGLLLVKPKTVLGAEANFAGGLQPANQSTHIDRLDTRGRC
jgi:hypothetical protein